MNISLSPDLQRLVQDEVESGAYETPEDVVAAALVTLQQVREYNDFAPGELDKLLEAGKKRSELEGTIPADQVFDEVKKMSEEWRRQHRETD